MKKGVQGFQRNCQSVTWLLKNGITEKKLATTFWFLTCKVPIYMKQNINLSIELIKKTGVKWHVLCRAAIISNETGANVSGQYFINNYL